VTLLLAAVLGFCCVIVVALNFPGEGKGEAQGMTESSTPNATAAQMRTVGLNDNHTEVRLQAGSEFLLELGEGGWVITLQDPGIVVRVPNITVVRGAQGVYVAKCAGRTVLMAARLPPQGTPEAAANPSSSQEVAIELVVESTEVAAAEATPC